MFNKIISFIANLFGFNNNSGNSEFSNLSGSDHYDQKYHRDSDKLDSLDNQISDVIRNLSRDDFSTAESKLI